MKTFPKVEIAPLKDVDTFWHYHILDTMKYARDCEQIFGYFQHHSPYLGMEDEHGREIQRQAGERIRELYQATFNLPYAQEADVHPAPGASARTSPRPAIRKPPGASVRALSRQPDASG